MFLLFYHASKLLFFSGTCSIVPDVIFYSISLLGSIAHDIIFSVI